MEHELKIKKNKSISAEIFAKEIKIVALKDIKLNPKNRNKHPEDQIKRLVKIIKETGFRRPGTISNRTGFLVCGEGRYLAAKKIGLKEMPVMYQDYKDAAQEIADSVADNAIDKWAELDTSGIMQDLKEFEEFDLDLLGIKDFRIVEPTIEPQCDEDEVPDKVEPRTKLGDIYQLGRHRLMCGDSTSIDAVEKLMNGERADICFTSPPYNVGRTPNGNEQKYLNDSDNREESEFCDFLYEFTSTALTVCDYVFSNIQSLSGNKIALIDYLYKMKSHYADTIIWDKMTAEPAMAKNVLNSRFEYIHVFSHRANRVIGSVEFRGTLENVFQFNSRKDKEYAHIHKATFPVSFAEHFITNFASKSVLDTFGGSGTTMISCEKTNRKCFMMELDPHYCDVIVARWEKYTGQVATRQTQE